MKIGIIGCGVVGGTTATVFERRHEILRYDKFKEPFCGEEVLKNLARWAEVVFVCVPTPMQRSGEIDYSPIHNSLYELTEAMENVGRAPDEILTVIRSTAVSGTSDKLSRQYGLRIAVNPEFLRERHALDDMDKTSYVVIGTEDNRSRDTLRQLYREVFPIVECVTVIRRTAEATKYCANGMLAGQIALANEFANICDALDVKWNEVKKIILRDPRIGRNLAVPGPDGDRGFGGKCLPKDINALTHKAQEEGYSAHLLREIWRSNLAVREYRDWEQIPGAVSSPHKKTGNKNCQC